MTQKTAFVFPGQGSQSVGMLSKLAPNHPIIQETYQQASTILDYDLWELVEQGPEEKLNQTEHTQPALLAASVALWRVWQQKENMQPVIMAGHSLGEYTALVCAGALDYNDAIALVASRGQYMQAAVKEGEGAMAAIIGLDNEAINLICEQASESQILSPANYNAIGQTVLAGETTAVDRAIILAKEKGAKIAKKIPVSVPSHSPLMEPAAEKLKTKLAEIQISKPTIPVINNVGVTITDQPDEIREALVAQLYSPVRWVETVQHIASVGVEQIIECGPGKVLTGLNKRIVKDIPTTPIADLIVNVS